MKKNFIFLVIFGVLFLVGCHQSEHYAPGDQQVAPPTSYYPYSEIRARERWEDGSIGERSLHWHRHKNYYEGRRCGGTH